MTDNLKFFVFGDTHCNISDADSALALENSVLHRRTYNAKRQFTISFIALFFPRVFSDPVNLYYVKLIIYNRKNIMITRPGTYLVYSCI
jgi:hypothetical protein